MKNIILTSITFLTLSLISCNSNPVDAEENLVPGRRDYVWTVDSVDYGDLPGRIELHSIWGSSPDNVWGAGFTEDVRNCFWHYDGEKWSRAVWNTPITQFGNGSKSVGGVWGTAADDVWAFGGRIFSSNNTTEPFIMHYDGTRWAEVIGDKSQMPIGFRDIYAIRKDHFWISSSEYVSEYKDGVWKKYFISDNYIIQSIEGIGNNVYLTAYPIGVDTLYLMKLNGDKFIFVDQTKLFSGGKYGHNGLLFANNKVYTFNGYGIFTTKINGEELAINSWVNELSTSGKGFSNSFLSQSKDIWAIGSNKYPYQFNGQDWQLINIYNKIREINNENWFLGIWGNGKEIFISDIENGIIYHGK